MKNIVALFSSLLLIIIFGYGCSSIFGSEDNSDDLKVVGTWLINSENEAEWVGKNSHEWESALSKSKIDTSIVLPSPDGILLEISSNREVTSSGEMPVEFTYVDSTITENIVESDSIKVNYSKLYIKQQEIGAEPFRINRRIPSVDEHALTIFIEFLYTCDMQVDGEDNMQVDLYNEDHELINSKRLETAGFQEVLDDTFCTD